MQKLYTDFLSAHAAGDKSGLEKVRSRFVNGLILMPTVLGERGLQSLNHQVS